MVKNPRKNQKELCAEYPIFYVKKLGIVDIERKCIGVLMLFLRVIVVFLVLHMAGLYAYTVFPVPIIFHNQSKETILFNAPLTVKHTHPDKLIVIRLNRIESDKKNTIGTIKIPEYDNSNHETIAFIPFSIPGRTEIKGSLGFKIIGNTLFYDISITTEDQKPNSQTMADNFIWFNDLNEHQQTVALKSKDHIFIQSQLNYNNLTSQKELNLIFSIK